MHWFYDPAVTEESSKISPTELAHFKALRIRNGDQIVVTNGSGVIHHAEVTDVTSGEIRQIEKRSSRKPALEIHLVQALAKSGRDEAAVQTACELGVSSITPLQAKRSIVEWGAKAERNRERWHQIAISAMKQSQQAFLPAVLPLVATRDLVGQGQSLVLDPRAEKSLSEIELQAEITLVVGPEGGFDEGELAALKAKDFQGVRLGESVLRTSSAGPAAIAAIQALSGLWNRG